MTLEKWIPALSFAASIIGTALTVSWQMGKFGERQNSRFERIEWRLDSIIAQLDDTVKEADLREWIATARGTVKELPPWTR